MRRKKIRRRWRWKQRRTGRHKIWSGPIFTQIRRGGVGVGRTDIKVSGEDEEGRDKGVGIFNPDPG